MMGAGSLLSTRGPRACWIVSPQLSLIGFFLCLLTLIVGLSGQCSPGDPAEKAGVSLPDLGSLSFKAELAGYSPTDYKAMSSYEHFSKESGRGSVHYEGAANDHFFTLTEKDHIWALGQGESCLNLSSPAPLEGQLLHMTKLALDPDKATFIETIEKAGIPTIHWRTCFPFSLEDEDVEATMDTYISNDDEWKMYSGSKDVLLSLAVTVLKDHDELENHFLNFLTFEPMKYDANKFQADLEAPLGIPCIGTTPDLQQPKVPSSVSFRQEIVSRHFDTSYITEMDRIVIDTENKVFQTQSSVATTLQDFNSGVKYFIMRVKGISTGCTILPVNRLITRFREEDISSGLTMNDHYVTMSSVEDHLFLSGGFAFNGEYEERGIQCNVFTHVTNNYEGKGKTASILLYFTKPGIGVADSGGLSLDKLIKIEVRVEGAPPIIRNINNLNEFDFDEASETPYDISPCFGEAHRIEFKLDLSEEYVRPQSVLSGSERRALERGVRRFIAQTCRLNLVRVQVGMVADRFGAISITGKLFARPDSGVLFDHYEGKSFGDSQGATERVLSVTQGVTHVDNCADIAASNIDASDADYCYTQKTCILYRAGGSDANVTLVGDEPCAHLTKIKGYEQQTTMYEAWDILEKAVYQSTPQIKIEDKYFKLLKIKKTNDPYTKLHKVSPLNSFKKTAHMEMATSKRHKVERRLGLKECAERCLDELLFPCEAFSYCSKESSCELYGEFPRIDTEHVSDDGRVPNYRTEANCDTYVRSYLHNFEHHPGRVSSMISTDSDVEIADVTGRENCAKLCMNRDDFQCEAFDFCSPGPLTGSCILRRRHWRDFTWSGEVKDNVACSHYSRNYIWDYTRSNGITSFPVASRVINAGGVESCAYQCSSSPDCDSFHFCESGEVCEYLDTRERKPTLQDITPMYRCYTFVQKETVDVKTRHDALVDKLGRTPPLSISGYSGGAMAGLAVAMLVVGAALCFLGLYAWTAWKRHRAMPRDGLDNSFSVEMKMSDAETP